MQHAGTFCCQDLCSLIATCIFQEAGKYISIGNISHLTELCNNSRLRALNYSVHVHMYEKFLP